MKWLESKVGGVAALNFKCTPQPSNCFEFVLIDHNYTVLAAIFPGGAAYKNLNTSREAAEHMTSRISSTLSCSTTTFRTKLGIHDKEVVAYQGDYARGTEFVGAEGMPSSAAGDLLYISFQTHCELKRGFTGKHFQLIISIIIKFCMCMIHNFWQESRHMFLCWCKLNTRDW